ncbi:uncharacterized protein LOC27206557 isoform X1 [Drosophila simulans]|uniref:Uncharacterized protein, isoform D n=3 Tax=Drosophila simulans TaxID=7240 RepID=A0A0J9R3C4_DROSI|nr:uncharacterized protein LOC27206557 isoform X1 [Drosophila simulans]KMY90294.1 uncharacterized protein Dsimw501_GD23982, isoform D [Drosophila simulans]
MPIIANETIRNRKEVNGQTIKKTPTCNVSHGLGRRQSLTGVSQKVKNVKNYKLSEEGTTTWLNCHSQTIGVQKKHITDLGIDVNNFFEGPVMKNRPKPLTPKNNISDTRYESKLRNDTNDPGCYNNMVTRQQPNKIFSHENKLHILLNPEIVKPIDKGILDKLKKLPRRASKSRNCRVQKSNTSHLSKPLYSTTKRRSEIRMSKENLEYDNITLCNFEDIIPRYYQLYNDSEKCYSSDTGSDDTITESSLLDNNDIFTSEEEDDQSRTGYESGISTGDEDQYEFDSHGQLLAEDKDDSDIFLSKEEVYIQGHKASELTNHSKKDERLLPENYFIVDNDFKNDAQYGEDIKCIDQLFRGVNPTWKVRQAYVTILQIATPCWPHMDASLLTTILLSCDKQLTNQVNHIWMVHKPCVYILQVIRPSRHHSYASHLHFNMAIRPGEWNNYDDPHPTLVVTMQLSSLLCNEEEESYFEQTQEEMLADGSNHISPMEVNHYKQLMNNIYRRRILLELRVEEEMPNADRRRELVIFEFSVICNILSAIAITTSFLIFQDIFSVRPNLTFWQRILVCFGIDKSDNFNYIF